VLLSIQEYRLNSVLASHNYSLLFSFISVKFFVNQAAYNDTVAGIYCLQVFLKCKHVAERAALLKKTVKSENYV
jgi:hypothetical protein